jgi:uncharacterized protein (TIGR00255 family)
MQKSEQMVNSPGAAGIGANPARMSMTGYAAQRGALPEAGVTWSWDLRAVNGKGLDLRLRLPDWIEGLEPLVRAALSGSIGRGSVSLSLRVVREAGGATLRVNPAALADALNAIAGVEKAARNAGVSLAQTSAADLLTLRGVAESEVSDEDTTALRDALMADLPTLIVAFNNARAAEGAAMARLIAGQIDQIAELTNQARTLAEARKDRAADVLGENLRRIMAAADGMDEARLAQELAILAVKSDVTEEIDRLDSHVAAARKLLDTPGPVGRKFDFLMQEFNREANTLCSKAQAVELTRVGLDLKHVIDQLREQIQNVE